MKYILILIGIGLIVGIGLVANDNINDQTKRQEAGETNQDDATTSHQDLEPEKPANDTSREDQAKKESLMLPTEEFESRITKKSFGTYVEPGNSPVDPEKFTGYHTAVDIEYGDVEGEVPVWAIDSGIVEVSRQAQGYGGVVIIRHRFQNKDLIAVYGHLDPASMPKRGEDVAKGEQIGRLGDAYSEETDDERKHLHFGLLKGGEVDLRGYVQNQSELNKWHEPVHYMKANGD